MTLALRQRHRRTIFAIGLVVGFLFVMGLLKRQPVPETETLPRELAPQTQTFSATGEELGELFGDSRIRVGVWREQETGSLAVGFIADKNFLKPDLLAYWSAVHPAKSDALPADATLLGALVGGPLLLPKEASVSDGSLILYSLANHEIVDVSKQMRFAGRTK
jgi:hypothetical protein